MEYRTIGANLRKIRLQKNMRQEDLAEKTSLSPNYIGAVERGERIPSLETFITLLNALNTSSDVVLCDVTNNGYEVKHSIIHEKLNSLCKEDQQRIYDVIDTLISHAKTK